jgi:hypothetical protein
MNHEKIGPNFNKQFSKEFKVEIKIAILNPGGRISRIFYHRITLPKKYRKSEQTKSYQIKYLIISQRIERKYFLNYKPPRQGGNY